MREGFGAERGPWSGVMGRASEHFGSMKIYREGLTRVGWDLARRRRLNLGLGRARMYTYGGMCHEHSGVILYVGAIDESEGRDIRDFVVSSFWELGWIHNPSIIVEGLGVCKLWRGSFRVREGMMGMRRTSRST